MNVRRTDLGRMATFLIPEVKLPRSLKDGRTAEEAIREFLMTNYDGFTEDPRLSTGWWTADTGEKVPDRNRLFTSAFLGKDRIPELERFLAQLAREIEEDCIILTTGEQAYLVHALTETE